MQVSSRAFFLAKQLPVFTVLLLGNTQIKVFSKGCIWSRGERRILLWGTEQGSKERFGQRGDVTWFGIEGLLRQRGLKAADTQEQGNTANKKSRSSMLEECLWQRGLVVLLAACSCDLHTVYPKSTSSFSWTGTIYRETAKTTFLDTQQRCWLSSHQRIGLASGNRAVQSHPFHVCCSWSDQTIVCRAWIAELHVWNWNKIPTPKEVGSKSLCPQTSWGWEVVAKHVCVDGPTHKGFKQASVWHTELQQQQDATNSLGALL